MKEKRAEISKRTRFEVFKRDNFTCRYCGRSSPAVVLHVDHVVAVAAGGDNDPANLISACADCNQGKGATALTVRISPADVAALRAQAKEAKAQAVAYAKLRHEQVAEQDALIHETMELVGAALGQPTNQLGDQYRGGIRYLLGFLAPADIKLAAQMATERVKGSDRSKILYMLKVCHNWRRERGGRP